MSPSILIIHAHTPILLIVLQFSGKPVAMENEEVLRLLKQLRDNQKNFQDGIMQKMEQTDKLILRMHERGEQPTIKEDDLIGLNLEDVVEKLQARCTTALLLMLLLLLFLLLLFLLLLFKWLLLLV